MTVIIPSTSVPSTTVLDIITDALTQINADGGETPDAKDANVGLRTLNRMLDAWRTESLYAYAHSFTTSTLVAASSYLIGPIAADITVTDRPDEIISASIVDSTQTPNARLGLNILDSDDWGLVNIPSITSTRATSLYYQPDSPNGKIFLWPVPGSGFDIELETKTMLSKVNITDAMTLPPGYEDAIVLSLAERLAIPFQQPVSSELATQALAARLRIKSLNAAMTTIHGADASLPTSCGTASYGDFLSGKY